MERYYIETSGNDDKAYREAINFACNYANEKDEKYEIILYAISKNNVGWLNRIYDRDTVKLFFNGHQFPDCKSKIKIETRKTLKRYHSSINRIIIGMGMGSEDIMILEDIMEVKVIIAIPWLEKDLDKWIKTLQPIEIRGNSTPDPFDEPSCIVKVALSELTERINISSGLTHHMDENLAKTFVRTFHKYNVSAEPDMIEGYLIKVHKWYAKDANSFAELIRKIQAGKRFKGGDKTGLQYNNAR